MSDFGGVLRRVRNCERQSARAPRQSAHRPGGRHTTGICATVERHKNNFSEINEFNDRCLACERQILVSTQLHAVFHYNLQTISFVECFRLDLKLGPYFRTLQRRVAFSHFSAVVFPEWKLISRDRIGNCV